MSGVGSVGETMALISNPLPMSGSRWFGLPQGFLSPCITALGPQRAVAASLDGEKRGHSQGRTSLLDERKDGRLFWTPQNLKRKRTPHTVGTSAWESDILKASKIIKSRSNDTQLTETPNAAVRGTPVKHKSKTTPRRVLFPTPRPKAGILFMSTERKWKVPHTKGALPQHVWVGLRAPWFSQQCPVCMERLDSMGIGQKHMKRIHKVRCILLICSTCGMSKTSVSSLSVHAVHCNKTESSRRGLSGPAACTMCTKSFGSNRGLTQHMRNAHPATYASSGLPKDVAITSNEIITATIGRTLDYLKWDLPSPPLSAVCKDKLMAGLKMDTPPSRGIINKEFKDFVRKATRHKHVYVKKRGTHRRFTKSPKAVKFSFLQRMWQHSRQAAVAWILDGTDSDTRCPLEVAVVEEHYEKVWEASDTYNGLKGFGALPTANNQPFLTRIAETETLATIKNMSQNTSPGPDKLSRPDLLKADKDGSKLTRMFNHWLIAGRIPKTLKTSRTTLLPKGVSADKMEEVTSWRPISISSTILRTFTNILAKRLAEACPPHPRQKGFVQDQGCASNVFTVDSLIRQVKRSGGTLAAVFIDLSKAFDTVPHKLIIDSLKARKVDKIIVDLISDSLYGCKSIIKLQRGQTRPMHLKIGVKQGDPLSPLLFNLAIDPLLYALERSGQGAELDNDNKLTVLAYADDLLVLSNSWNGMAQNLKILEIFCELTGLKVNPQKCHGFLLHNGKNKCTLNNCSPWAINGHPLHMANANERIPYLGMEINPWIGVSTPSLMVELKRMLDLISKSPLKATQKVYVLKCYVIPRLLYKADLGGLSITALNELDGIIRKTAKLWLHLPQFTTNGLLYVSLKNGGLGIPRLTNLVPSMQIKRLVKLMASNDKICNTLARSNQWDSKVLKLWNRITGGNKNDPVSNLDLPHITGKALKNREFKKWAASQTQGTGIECFWNDPISNAWIKDPTSSGLTVSQFIRGLQLRSNSAPTRCVLFRGRGDANKRCRLCGLAPESTLHLLAVCKGLQLNRMTTHNKICSLLADVAEKLGWKTKKEPHIYGDHGKKGVPDLILFKKKRVMVVDVTVTFESSVYSLDNAAKNKVIKYKPFESAVQRLFPEATKILFWGFPVGARGKWPPQNFKLLQTLGLAKTRQRKLACTLSSIALKGSIKTFSVFLGLTR